MILGLVQLFEAIVRENQGGLPLSINADTNACNDGQGELFGGSGNDKQYKNFPGINEADIAIVAGMHAKTGIDFSLLQPEILDFFELSRDAFGAVVYAWMSELSVTEQIIRFGKKILTSKNTVADEVKSRGKIEADRRKNAQIAASDRGDQNVQTVREAAYKVWHEIHRLTGLLRFCPNENGVYIARCEPDHFILPALGPHFMERFGETPWTIIDNKRNFSLGCTKEQSGAYGKDLVFTATAGNPPSVGKGKGGEWENLWKHYHKTINNESRNNPDLQKRFMPTRYWKYLTEL